VAEVTHASEPLLGSRGGVDLPDPAGELVGIVYERELLVRQVRVPRRLRDGTVVMKAGRDQLAPEDSDPVLRQHDSRDRARPVRVTVPGGLLWDGALSRVALKVAGPRLGQLVVRDEPRLVVGAEDDVGSQSSGIGNVPPLSVEVTESVHPVEMIV